MYPAATAPSRTLGLQAALAAYEADFDLMPPSLQPDVHQLVESDLEAIRCLVADAAPDVRERWSCLIHFHARLTDATLKNLLAAGMGHAKPVSEAELVRLRGAHEAALSALRRCELSLLEEEPVPGDNGGLGQALAEGRRGVAR